MVCSGNDTAPLVSSELRLWDARLEWLIELGLEDGLLDGFDGQLAVVLWIGWLAFAVLHQRIGEGLLGLAFLSDLSAL